MTGDDFLDEVTTHLLAAGGKRLRPVLALATATSGAAGRLPGGPARRRGRRARAPGLALPRRCDGRGHRAAQRRERQRPVRQPGGHRGRRLPAGPLGRDRRRARAWRSPPCWPPPSGELCQGQVAEVQAAFQADRSRDEYSTAIAGKTAALMATSCRIGALTGGLARAQVDAFTEFGRCFGMIFQVRDDILDVVGTEAELGKPAGQDLAEGIYTLPVLLTLADPVHGPELRDLLGQPLGLPEQEKARSIVAGSGAIAESVRVARGYAEDGGGGGGGRALPGAGRRRSPGWPTRWWTACPPADATGPATRPGAGGTAGPRRQWPSAAALSRGSCSPPGGVSRPVRQPRRPLRPCAPPGIPDARVSTPWPRRVTSTAGRGARRRGTHVALRLDPAGQGVQTGRHHRRSSGRSAWPGGRPVWSSRWPWPWPRPGAAGAVRRPCGTRPSRSWPAPGGPRGREVGQAVARAGVSPAAGPVSRTASWTASWTGAGHARGAHRQRPRHGRRRQCVHECGMVRPMATAPSVVPVGRVRTTVPGPSSPGSSGVMWDR